MRQKTDQHYVRKNQKYRKYNRHRTKRQQKGGFLNRCNFAYAGWDATNEAFKNLNNTAPKLISQTSKEVDRIVEAIISKLLTTVDNRFKKLHHKSYMEQ